jgi:hypothetical protein
MLRSALLSLVMLSASACATTNRAQYGNVNLRPYGEPGAVPRSFSVQQGRILSGGLDAVLDPDGCIRGSVGNSGLELCPAKGLPPPAEKPGDKVEQWTGASGNFTLEMMENESRLRMDGYLRPVGSARSLPMNATIPLGRGPQWDELRKHPAFLALAAAVSGVHGEPNERALLDATEQ